MPPKKTTTTKTKVKNEIKAEIKNGLTEAILGFNPGNSIGTPINQATTLFKNNRWYLVSNMRQLLSQIYVEHGIIQTVVDVPVDDGLRGGVEIKSKQLDPKDIERLTVVMEENDDIGKAGQALKWNRLYGGAGILILTDQDPQTPLDIDAINEYTPLEFRAVDMWELFYNLQNTEGYDAQIQEHEFEFYNYYGKQVHKSRVKKLKGMVAPSFIRPRLRGWGFSIVEALVNSVNQYLKANNLIFEVLDEFKIDVYKIKNLVNTLLSPQGTETVQRRIQLANLQKNFQHAVTMDSEDDFIQKELTFSGIAETMQGIRMQIASDLRMPLTKVFGISAAGFSSGEDDIENYNSMVESQVRQKIKFIILQMIKIRCQQLFGNIPDDITITFKPLRILSAEQEENVKTQKFNRLLQAKAQGEIDSLEFRDACNKDNLLGIQLQTKDIPEGNIQEGPDNKDDSAKIAPLKSAPSVTTAPEAKT